MDTKKLRQKYVMLSNMIPDDLMFFAVTYL